MKKQFVKTMLVALALAGCHPVPASAAQTIKGEMREMAMELCVKAVGIDGHMLECIELVSSDYYDAAMKGGKRVLDKDIPNDTEIVSITKRHLPCAAQDVICQQTQVNYMTWFKYGSMSIIEKDKEFKGLVEAYYSE